MAKTDVAEAAVEHKDLFVPAAVGLAGALAAVKGPSVVRRLSGAVEFPPSTVIFGRRMMCDQVQPTTPAGDIRRSQGTCHAQR
jgi:hypothetical protein